MTNCSHSDVVKTISVLTALNIIYKDDNDVFAIRQLFLDIENVTSNTLIKPDPGRLVFTNVLKSSN